MGGNQNTTIPDLMIEPTTIVKTKDKNNQYVYNNVNKINNNLRQPKHNVLQRYNRNVLNSLRKPSNECENINTIDTVSNNH
jgi:hypothetical protein